MKSLRLLWLCVCALPLAAQISGVVLNASTEKPEAGVTINLVHPGENGMQTMGIAKSDAEGKFQIDQPVPPPPALLQATFQDVQYTSVLQPGAPANGVRVSVFNATSKAAEGALAQQHLVMVEPGTDGVRVSETFLIQNSGKTTYLDPVKGSVQFYLPKEAQASAKVTIQAPNGMPINRPPEKTSQADTFKIGYPVKPGETTYDVGYALPPGSKLAGKVLGQGPVIVVTPESVTLSGTDLKEAGIKQLGQGGPRVRVYEVTAKSGASYEASITGTGTVRTPEGEEQPSEEDGGPPKPKAGQARVYERLPWVLGLGFGILGLGGALLYRRSPA